MKRKEVITLSENIICLLLIFLFPTGMAELALQPHANVASSLVVVADFNVPVDPGSSSFMNRVVNYATSQQAAAIIIQMNTPGGLLNDVLAIVSSVAQANQSGISVYAFVPPNSLAASAGSYIAMSCNRIFMGSGSAIGPSTPIVVGGSPLEQNHTQAAMLKLMVGLAQKWGRNATTAYYMVQADEAFSADEAFRYHIVDGLANSISEVLNKVGLSGSQQVFLNENLYDQFISAISNPILDGILLLLGVLAIVIDIQHPTVLLSVIGAASIISGLIGADVISASLLGFFIIAVAAALIVLELKLGHGFAMMAGIALGALGILYLAYGLSYSPSPITTGTELVLFIIVVVGILAGLYFRWVIGPLRRRFKMTGPESLVGQIGIAVTDLKPSGEVRVAGYIWGAESVSGDVNRGESVKVISVKGLSLVVEKA